MKETESNNYLFILLIFICSLGFISSKTKDNGSVMLGAYYFDGWSPGSSHITPILTKSFSEREPKWGWATSRQDIIDRQIIEASNAGLSFFSFCWYTSKENQKNSLNNALELYHKSRYNKRLKFCLLVANHEGSYITPKNWDSSTDQWIKEVTSKQYLTVEGKPLIIFFSIDNLMNMFGRADSVKAAFDTFRSKAVKSGLGGLSIAVCVTSKGTTLKLAEDCGFDLVTGYNHHGFGFSGPNQQIPLDSMQNAEYKMWNNLSNWSKLPYIPVSTLNWDPRPWANARNGYDQAHFYVGFSQESVYRSVSQLVNWLRSNTQNTTREKVGLLYAWNENGEGAYLTPSKNGDNMLMGVKKALTNPTKLSSQP